MSPGSRWAEMVHLLRALPEGELGSEQLLTAEFFVAEEGRLQMYWIPLERLNPAARVAIVGLTPGWHQMQQAFTAARDAFHTQITDDMQVLERIDRQASFAGSMRTNMVKMLDAIGLAKALDVSTSASLFLEDDHLIHGTSALRYPVFLTGKNYGGGNPRVDRSPLLTSYMRERLGAELSLIPEALVLPLGNAVEGCLRMLIASGQLDEARCLFGFPHPSGANGHRVTHFRRNEDMLRVEIKRWATKYG